MARANIVPNPGVVTITLESWEEVQCLTGELQSAYEHLNYVPTIKKVLTQLNGVHDG